MKKFLILFFVALATSTFASPGNIYVNHFEVRENPFAENQISIVATDTLHNVQQNVNGVFVFTINGFEDTLKFNSGVAFYKHTIDRSTFLYARHVNDNGIHSSLYYVYKGETKLFPMHISWILLLAIPLALVLLGYMFKRFITIAIVIFCIFIFFNYHSNLSIPTFFQSIFDGLKGLF